MNTIARSATIVATTIAFVSCAVAPPAADSRLIAVPPPEFQRDLPLEPPALIAGSACKLGTSCLDMDPRPFGPCLVDTRPCAEKALEPVTVTAPGTKDEPRSLQIRR